jgi:hypothetical protein
MEGDKVIMITIRVDIKQAIDCPFWAPIKLNRYVEKGGFEAVLKQMRKRKGTLSIFTVLRKRNEKESEKERKRKGTSYIANVKAFIFVFNFNIL